MVQDIQTDILIIGGGIAGCIAAIALSDRYDVLLIDKKIEPQPRIGESLAPAAIRILKRLNLWEDLPKETFRKNIGMQSYWGSDECHIVDHLANPDGHVLNLNRQDFEKYLRTVAAQRGVECLWGVKYSESQADENGWRVVINTDSKQQSIKAGFVIDASGRQSHFSREQGIKRHHIDKLVACWLTLPNGQENTMSTIASVEQGWWYSAVLPENKRVVAFHSDSDLMNRAFKDDKASFIVFAKENGVMHNYFDHRKNDDQTHSTLHGLVPANSTCSQHVVGQRWAAIGDAAISFDPLSSQGMFNAMACAVQLTDLINKYDVINHSDKEAIHQFEKTYTQQINQIWLHYLNHKDLFYRQEMRWKTQPFWQRRHAN